MAANIGKLEEVDDPLCFLRNKVFESWKEIAHLDQRNIETCCMKLNRKLSHGDLILPAFLRTRSVPSVNNSKNDLQELCKEVIKCVTSIPLVSQCVITDAGHLILNLQRAGVTRDVICNVMTKGDWYGRVTNGSSGNVLLNPVLALESQNHCWESLKLDNLRTFLLCDHSKELFEARGIIVKPVPLVASLSRDFLSEPSVVGRQSREEILELFCLPQIEPDNHMNMRILPKEKELMKTLRGSKFEESLQFRGATESSSSGDIPETKCKEWTESERCSSKDGDKVFSEYNDNLSDLPVAVSSSFLRDVAILELVGESVDSSSMIVHVMSCRTIFKQDQVSTVWRLISASPLSNRQHNISHGLVSVHNNGSKLQATVTVRDLLRIRKEQLWQSYVLKYGDKVKGVGWEATIRDMAVASIKLEMLSVSPNSEVKINLCDSSPEFRQATFVMYNCARLAKLFENFKESVGKGLYPALPLVTEVDFSLLRDQSEWDLVLNFVIAFPSVIAEAVPTVTWDRQALSIQTNKVSCFLFNLCHKLSSYYSRVHILGESRQHLFPVMFARLYLMKALQQILWNCLKLLNIKALTQM